MNTFNLSANHLENSFSHYKNLYGVDNIISLPIDSIKISPIAFTWTSDTRIYITQLEDLSFRQTTLKQNLPTSIPQTIYEAALSFIWRREHMTWTAYNLARSQCYLCTGQFTDGKFILYGLKDEFLTPFKSVICLELSSYNC